MQNRTIIFISCISLGSGGAEKVISILLKYLVKYYDVHLILFHNVIHFDIPKEISVKILSAGLKSNRVLGFPILSYRYWLYAKQFNPSVHISFLTRPNIMNGILKYFNPSMKIVMSERGFPSLNYKSSFMRLSIYKILIPIFYNKADIIFSNSVHINRDLQSNFRVRRTLKVLYNPVQIQPQKEYFKNLIFRVISVGSFRAIKNHKMLLEAIQNDLYTEASLLGDGPLRNELITTAINLGIDSRVHFVGLVRDVSKHLSNSDCFVLTSDTEGFPNALLEAMADGLPVISTNCYSGPLEILNENIPATIPKGSFYKAKYGLLVNVKDTKGLENALEYFKVNPNEREYYGNLAYKRAKNYNIEIFYNEFNELLSLIS